MCELSRTASDENGAAQPGNVFFVVVLLMSVSTSFIPPGMADIKSVPLCSPGDRFNLAVRHIPVVGPATCM